MEVHDSAARELMMDIIRFGPEVEVLTRKISAAACQPLCRRRFLSINQRLSDRLIS